MFFETSIDILREASNYNARSYSKVAYFFPFLVRILMQFLFAR